MPTPSAATIRRKKTPGSPAAPRRRGSAKPSKAAARSRLAVRRFWPIAVIAAGVFLIAYILNWDAITALMWDCLAGQFGLTVSLASFGVLFLLGCGAALLWHRPIPQPPAKAPRKARRSPARAKKTERTEPGEAIPEDAPAATAPAATAPVATASPVTASPVTARPVTGDVVEKRPRKPKVTP